MTYSVRKTEAGYRLFRGEHEMPLDSKPMPDLVAEVLNWSEQCLTPEATPSGAVPQPETSMPPRSCSPAPCGT